MNRNATPYSNLKIFHHYEILDKLKKGEHCNPVYIRIKPTNLCNHNCYYCHYKNPYLNLDEYCSADFIPHDKMMEIIEDMGRMKVKAVTFSGGGEPLAYQYIEEAMEKVLRLGIDLSIITNGSLLNGKKSEILANSKWVRISIDSIHPKNYAKNRGIPESAMDNLLKNIEHFAKIKNNDCEFGVNFVVGRENYSEIEELAVTMKRLGVNHVKFAPLINNETEKYHEAIKDSVIASLNKLADELNSDTFKIIDLYTGDFEKEEKEVFQRLYSRCPMKEFICVIAANSKVYFCQDKAYLSGGCVCDLNGQSFYGGWNSEDVIKKFKEFNAVSLCRHHCVHDSRNELINSWLDTDMNHVNFI